VANTFVKIQTVTVGVAGAATIDFTSIPQSFTDLKIVLSARSTTTGTDGNPWTDINCTFNSLNTNFSFRVIYGTGTTTASGSATGGWFGWGNDTNSTASVFNNNEIYIPNYTSANHKSFSVDTTIENNGSASILGLSTNLWANTAAITAVSLAYVSGSFAQYSTATLYGIKSS
jgi:hypothetical protein